MNKEENMLQLIKVLEEENEQLKKRNMDLEKQIDIYKQNNDDDLAYLKSILKEEISKTKEARKKYKEAVLELYKIKKEYKKKLKSFFRQIDL